ncbi:helix-turn-helix domain-containing protein [Acetomicrobium sp.]|uniref:helix-turn-helix domain-containing protein n=1 Tax=Acetomicrobium sp. TaxID=1872099 RepID=UPI001BD101A0|nr:helix-turn-helix domain-containing protein [Acetomicrobium sp.]
MPNKRKEQPESTDIDSAELAKRIGTRIKIARIKAGLKQKDLAEKVGLHRMSISAIESGRRGTSMAQLVEFSRVLGVPVSYFFTGAENETGETDEYTAELEKLLAILMERDAEAVANLRSVMESWDKLSPADKRFIINTISYALKSVRERMEE